MNLQELIDRELQKEQDSKKDRVRSGKFSPSLFGRCYRFQYWSRLNEPISDPLDARTLRKFKVGNLFHQFVEGLLPDHDTEVKVLTDDCLGYADVVTDDCVIDIKSVTSYDFRRFWDKKKEYDVFTDKANMWLQVGFYATILKKEKCALFFVSKDDLVTEQYFCYAKKLKEKIDVELKILKDYWAGGRIPLGEPRAYGNKECQYCGFRSKCDSPNKKIKESKE